MAAATAKRGAADGRARMPRRRRGMRRFRSMGGLELGGGSFPALTSSAN